MVSLRQKPFVEAKKSVPICLDDRPKVDALRLRLDEVLGYHVPAYVLVESVPAQRHSVFRTLTLLLMEPKNYASRLDVGTAVAESLHELRKWIFSKSAINLRIISRQEPLWIV